MGDFSEHYYDELQNSTVVCINSAFVVEKPNKTKTQNNNILEIKISGNIPSIIFLKYAKLITNYASCNIFLAFMFRITC